MTDLYDLLSDQLRLPQRSGEHHMLAACPVHKGGQERHPSFSVDLRSGKYHCFACKIKGDFEDLKILLRNPLTGAGFVQAVQQTEELNQDIDEIVLKFYHKCPVSLLDDGFEMATLKEHEIGYDDMCRRITYPIRDLDGKLVAISGRAPDGEEPRYKVYTHMQLRGAADELYRPRNKDFLWGGHLVDQPAEKLYVVEGFKACMWLRQHGLKNTVATMGTMVTKTQLDKLHRLCDRAILVFDMDDPGRQARKDVQFKLLQRGLPTTCIDYPARQPDELSKDQIDLYLNL